MDKPKYNMWQNSAFMIGRAWQVRKSVLWFSLITATLHVLSNLLGLYIAPVILGSIETAAPISLLIRQIVFFTAALMLTAAASAYVSQNSFFGRVEVRITLVHSMSRMFARTSYPNTEDQTLTKLRDKAGNSLNGNNGAGEAIWKTLTELVQNVAGFLIYLLLLSSIDPLIVAITIVTTAASYFISKRINEWGYRHRDEESGYWESISYVASKSSDRSVAKDIRLFGMHGWIDDMFDKSQHLLHAFFARREKVYIWADIIDALFAFLRNGIAYFYLIRIVLSGGQSAAEFLLYFSAVGGFTAWVTGILQNLSRLHQQSIDLCNVREVLEYPEPFKFEDGEPLEPSAGAYQIELRGVSFRYPGADEYTLRHVDLMIKPGEKIAVVGLNGAGKTTLIKLICGYFDPTEGSVLLNGEDTEGITGAIITGISARCFRISRSLPRPCQKISRSPPPLISTRHGAAWNLPG